MLIEWLEEITIGVTIVVLSTALIDPWAFRAKIWPGLASLYMSTGEAITIPMAHFLEIFQSLTRLTSDISRSRISAVFKFQFSISRSALQRESVRVSTASAAPTVRISDSKVPNTFPATYGDLVAECRKRYSDFKQNNRFHKLLESVKRDPCCAHERQLNPNSSSSSTRMFYNLDAVLVKFDAEYTKRK